MSPDQRLAQIARSLRNSGVDALVMGGHAVRYYGIDRNTSDFDLVVSVASPAALRNLLSEIPLLAGLKEVAVWRRDDFARFEIGTLPDGRQELLEFWIHNHLLPDFASLKARAEIGQYGGEEVAFISLDDLLRSKETERESDWQDISLLEEIRDDRLIADARSLGVETTILQGLRSRRGLERCVSLGLFADVAAVTRAVVNCPHPITFAMLYPLAKTPRPARFESTIDPMLLVALDRTGFQSTSHLGIVEVIRRAYKRKAMEADRLDKHTKVKALERG